MDNLNLLNHKIQNQKIRNAVKESIESNFPIESRGKTLVVKNVNVEDTLRDDNFPEQKAFKIKIIPQRKMNFILPDALMGTPYIWCIAGGCSSPFCLPQ